MKFNKYNINIKHQNNNYRQDLKHIIIHVTTCYWTATCWVHVHTVMNLLILPGRNLMAFRRPVTLLDRLMLGPVSRLGPLIRQPNQICSSFINDNLACKLSSSCCSWFFCGSRLDQAAKALYDQSVNAFLCSNRSLHRVKKKWPELQLHVCYFGSPRSASDNGSA